jgi:hypothetical protein
MTRGRRAYGLLAVLAAVAAVACAPESAPSPASDAGRAAPEGAGGEMPPGETGGDGTGGGDLETDESAICPDAGEAPVEPFVTIGTGTSRYETLSAGESMDIIQGPQGGYHVWGALRAGGIDPHGVTLNFGLYLGEKLVAEAHYEDDLVPTQMPEAPYEYTRVAVILIENDPGAVTDRPARLTVELVPADGPPLTDEVEVRPLCCH